MCIWSYYNSLPGQLQKKKFFPDHSPCLTAGSEWWICICWTLCIFTDHGDEYDRVLWWCVWWEWLPGLVTRWRCAVNTLHQPQSDVRQSVQVCSSVLYIFACMSVTLSYVSFRICSHLAEEKRKRRQSFTIGVFVLSILEKPKTYVRNDFFSKISKRETNSSSLLPFSSRIVNRPFDRNDRLCVGHTIHFHFCIASCPVPPSTVIRL